MYGFQLFELVDEIMMTEPRPSLGRAFAAAAKRWRKAIVTAKGPQTFVR